MVGSGGMTRVTQHQPFEDLRLDGVLWAINRHVFHPRGFALAFVYPDDATKEGIQHHEVQPIGWRLLGDGSEVWTYVSTQMAEVATLNEGVYPVDEDEAMRSFEILLDAHRSRLDQKFREIGGRGTDA